MSGNIPVQANSNHFTQHANRESVEDKAVEYEYIREATFEQFSIDYASDTKDRLATVLFEETHWSEWFFQSLLPWGGKDGQRTFRVKVHGDDDHLPMPCGLLEANPPERGLIEQYRLFSCSSDMDLKPGDVVYVNYLLGPNKTRQSVGIITRKATGTTTLPEREPNPGCDDLQNRFNDAEGQGASGTLGQYQQDQFEPPPANFPNTTPDEVLQESRCYDSGDIPNKSQHASVLNGLHPDFVPYVKLFICRAAEQGISIRLNSGYRSSDTQHRLYQQWVDGGRQGPAPSAGFSYHNFGMAIDFNPTLANGVTLLSSSPAREWDEVRQIGESVGLYWGGRFSTNYDPIHFDFRNNLPREQRQAHSQAAAEAGNTPNRHPISRSGMA
jgi:hypothetical protein